MLVGDHVGLVFGLVFYCISITMKIVAIHKKNLTSLPASVQAGRDC